VNLEANRSERSEVDLRLAKIVEWLGERLKAEGRRELGGKGVRR